MRIKIFIVTWNDPNTLHTTLEKLSLVEKKEDWQVQVNIINNHSNFHLHESFFNINVLHNVTRPDFSRGHLSRNWNQAIINGFKNLNNPNCDVLILSQDDTYWEPDTLLKLIDIHKKYTFYTCSYGDGFMSYLPDAVRKIGLWDERYNGICFQEADYFYRALLYNRDKSSVNDPGHGRVVNEEKDVISLENKIGIPARTHNGRLFSHDYCENLFKVKWPLGKMHWDDEVLNNLPNVKASAIPNFVYYPYFENDIELAGKNYFNYA